MFNSIKKMTNQIDGTAWEPRARKKLGTHDVRSTGFTGFGPCLALLHTTEGHKHRRSGLSGVDGHTRVGNNSATHSAWN
jgi:hypothetical protein